MPITGYRTTAVTLFQLILLTLPFAVVGVSARALPVPMSKVRELETRPNTVDESHALVVAVDKNDSKSLGALFDRGYSPATVISNKMLESLLDRAASHGSDGAFVLIMKELKLQGFKPKLTDSRGTPLLVVLSSLATVGQKMTDRYERMATALVQNFPESLTLTDHAYVGDGRTALHQAAANGNVNLIRVFILNGANINAKNTSGETPLHLAARFGHVDAVRYLIYSGAKIDEKTIFTKATPLMSAAEMGQETVIRLLMAAGAQKDERDIFGKSAPERYKEYASNFYTRLNNKPNQKQKNPDPHKP